MRQQLPELVGQLRGEGLVRCHHQGRALHLLDEPRGGRRLAGTGRAEQDDVGVTGADAAGELRDRGRLVTGRLEVRHDPQRRGRTVNAVTRAIATGMISSWMISGGRHASYNTTAVRQFPAGIGKPADSRAGGLGLAVSPAYGQRPRRLVHTSSTRA